jgi:hypothetical protein
VSGRSRSPSSAQDVDSDSSEPASDVSDPDENGDGGGLGLLGLQLAIFEVCSAICTACGVTSVARD